MNVVLQSFLLIGVVMMAMSCKSASIQSTNHRNIDFQNGDLIFLDLNCGELCEAIANVTLRQFKVSAPTLSHVGMLALEADGWKVYEAYDKVQKVTLAQFLTRNQQWFTARLNPEFRHLIPAALDFIRQEFGKPYDETFQRGNGKYYCSELIGEAFRHANRGIDLFDFPPMFYGDTEDPADAAAQIWRRYFAEKQLPIPAGKPGISPLGIFLSKVLTQRP